MDIVGFGDDGVWSARSNGDGSFAPAVYVFAQFGANTWYNWPRFFTDLNGDGYPDILGQRDATYAGGYCCRPAVFRSLGGPTGFSSAQQVLFDFAPSADPIAIGDVNGDGKQDLVDINYQKWAGPLLEGVFTMAALSIDSPLPAPPVAPSNTHVTAPTATSLTITWQSNSPDARYFVVNGDGVAPGTSHVIPGLSPDTAYCFVVYAVNWFGVSGASPQACGHTIPAPAVP